MHMFVKSRDLLAKVIIHLLVWSLVTFMLFIYPSLIYVNAKIPNDFVIKQVVHIILMVISYYSNALFLVPKLLLREKLPQFILGTIIVLFCSSYALNLVDNALDIAVQMAPIRGQMKAPSAFFDSFGFFTTLFVLAISTIISMMEKWNREHHRLGELENQQVKSELSFLKAQIHPHFFFNTLNTIYALTYTDISGSRKVLHTLSRMMRYLLYETQHNKVPLADELSFIGDYIEVMKLRVDANTKIIFSVDAEPENMDIAPMLLLPYIENAFKHGIDDIDLLTISIAISIGEHGISLTTKNTIVGNNGALTENECSKGIGLANTKRRLELLYEGKHILQTRIDETKNEYNLYLKLDLR